MDSTAPATSALDAGDDGLPRNPPANSGGIRSNVGSEAVVCGGVGRRVGSGGGLLRALPRLALMICGVGAVERAEATPSSGMFAFGIGWSLKPTDCTPGNNLRCCLVSPFSHEPPPMPIRSPARSKCMVSTAPYWTFVQEK